MKTLWICGQFIAQTDQGMVWEFQGIFSNEDMAIKACKNEHYFIGPAILNKEISHEGIIWPECYYPKLGSPGKYESVTDIKVFVDQDGNTYLPEDVMFCDIDTPGPQFMGYVTLESYMKTNYIDHWVEVEVRRDIDIGKLKRENIDGNILIKGVKFYKKT